jgi:hypothetical protein
MKNYWNWHPDKFLYRNGNKWWMRFTPYDPVIKRPRLAVNLNTPDIIEARHRRDAWLKNTGYEMSPRINLSPLVTRHTSLVTSP